MDPEYTAYRETFDYSGAQFFAEAGGLIGSVLGASLLSSVLQIQKAAENKRRFIRLQNSFLPAFLMTGFCAWQLSGYFSKFLGPPIVTHYELVKMSDLPVPPLWFCGASSDAVSELNSSRNGTCQEFRPLHDLKTGYQNAIPFYFREPVSLFVEKRGSNAWAMRLKLKQSITIRIKVSNITSICGTTICQRLHFHSKIVFTEPADEAQVSIFIEPDVDVYSESLGYEVTQFVADCGGIIGIFLGTSALHLLEFLVDWIFQKYRRCDKSTVCVIRRRAVLIFRLIFGIMTASCLFVYVYKLCRPPIVSHYQEVRRTSFPTPPITVCIPPKNGTYEENAAQLQVSGVSRLFPLVGLPPPNARMLGLTAFRSLALSLEAPMIDLGFASFELVWHPTLGIPCRKFTVPGLVMGGGVVNAVTIPTRTVWAERLFVYVGDFYSTSVGKLMHPIVVSHHIV